MYTIITCTILGLTLAVTLWRKGKLSAARLEPGLAISLIGLLCFEVGLAIAILLSLALPEKEVVTGPQPIVSMKRADGSTGTFIMGSGSIKSGRTLHYMLLSANGSVVPHSVPANQLVHITEDGSLKNSGTVTVTRIEWDRDSFLNNWSIFNDTQDRTVRIDFRVPVGTVVQRFSVR